MRQILKRILERSTDDGDEWEPPVGVLREAWPGLVGDELSTVTRPAAVDWQEGRLVVEAASEAWCRELRRHDDELLARLGEVLPWRLETLKVRQGMIEARDRSPDEPPDPETDPNALRSSDATDPAPDPVDPPDDVEDSLSSLGSETENTARRILEHVKDEKNS